MRNMFQATTFDTVYKTTFTIVNRDDGIND